MLGCGELERARESAEQALDEYVADGVTDALIESQALADSNPWAPRTTTRCRPSRSSLDC